MLLMRFKFSWSYLYYYSVYNVISRSSFGKMHWNNPSQGTFLIASIVLHFLCRYFPFKKYGYTWRTLKSDRKTLMLLAECLELLLASQERKRFSRPILLLSCSSAMSIVAALFTKSTWRLLPAWITWLVAYCWRYYFYYHDFHCYYYY